MRDKLEAIELFLVQMKRPVVQFLQPPLGEIEIGGRLRKLGLQVPEEIKAIYGWHDGVDTSRARVLGDLHVFPGFYFMSIDEAVASYAALSDDRRWNKRWLPIFGNGGGDFYVADLRKPDAPSVPVRRRMVDEESSPTVFVSLSAMACTLLECFSNGVFFASDGYLEADDVKYGKIAMKHNPTLDFWKSWT